MAKRKTAKKKAGKKTAKKKTGKKAAKKTASKTKARAKVKPASGKARTKSEIFGYLAEENGISRREVASIFESLSDLIEKDLGPRSVGQFTIPGLIKIKTQKKPATKARKGINPFTGEETMFKAKPAKTVIKARPLKNLKDMV